MSNFSPADESGEWWNIEFTAEQASQMKRTGPCPLGARLGSTGWAPIWYEPWGHSREKVRWSPENVRGPWDAGKFARDPPATS